MTIRPARTRCWPRLLAMSTTTTSEAGRARLGGLIPSVIGLTGEDLHIDARIALRCAMLALPVAASEWQQTMAVSVLACERVLADLDGRPAGWLEEQNRQALAQAPHAAQWACSFTRNLPISAKAFRRHAAPATVHAAVEGIARACVPQPGQMLRDLLIGAIGECTPYACCDAGRGTQCDRTAWAAACELTATGAAEQPGPSNSRLAAPPSGSWQPWPRL